MSRQEKRVLYLKACPRCGGDVHTNRDLYGPYKECLQCGHMVDLARANNYGSATNSRATKKKVA